MNLKNFNTNWNKPSIFTAQTYDTKTSVEIDHSDLDLNEVMDAFQTLIVGMKYNNDALKNWVLDKAAEYESELEADYIKVPIYHYIKDDGSKEYDFEEMRGFLLEKIELLNNKTN